MARTKTSTSGLKPRAARVGPCAMHDCKRLNETTHIWGCPTRARIHSGLPSHQPTGARFQARENLFECFSSALTCCSTHLFACVLF